MTLPLHLITARFSKVYQSIIVRVFHVFIKRPTIPEIEPKFARNY